MKRVFGVAKAPHISANQEPDCVILSKMAAFASPYGNVNMPSRTFPTSAILDTPMSAEWNYFQIQILKEGDLSEVGIGIGPVGYDLSDMPGWGPRSIGYHADNGGLYHCIGTGRTFGMQCHTGDTMGCGADYSSQKHGYITVWFTKNGELAGPPEKVLLPHDGLYPLIGLSCWNAPIQVRYCGHSCSPLPFDNDPSPLTQSPRVLPHFSTVKVDFPYDAHLPDEITLTPGADIEVVSWDVDSRPAWAVGRLKSSDKEGFFPTDFVRPTFPGAVLTGWSTSGFVDTYKGQMYVFAEKPEEALECLICREITCDPHRTVCCSCTLCLQCAAKWKERNDSCVNCRKEPLELEEDLDSCALVASTTVSCANGVHGCEWKGLLPNGEHHLQNECVFGYLNKEFAPDTIVDCPCCSRTLVDSRTHQKLFCGRMRYAEIVRIHHKCCPEWPMRCPNGCSETFTRSSLPIHLKEDCPEQIVACDFHYIGCSVCIERKRMQQHLNEGIAQHLTLLLGDYMNVKEQLKCVTEELEKTKEENVRLREDQQVLSDELHQRRQAPTNYQQNQF